jgi:hypothetical protein
MTLHTGGRPSRSRGWSVVLAAVVVSLALWAGIVLAILEVMR